MSPSPVVIVPTKPGQDASFWTCLCCVQTPPSSRDSEGCSLSSQVALLPAELWHALDASKDGCVTHSEWVSAGLRRA